MITLFDNETILKGYTREKVNAARAEARAEGLKTGSINEKIEMAKKMLQESLPIDLIVRISGLSDSEVKEIKAKMVN